jgi:hypothetical protein
MNRPEVRIIDGQQVQQNDVEVSGYEASALLAKYGFKQQTQPATTPSYNTPADTRSFEEIVREQEARERARFEQQMIDRNRPRSITFDDSRGAWTESKWSSADDGSGNQFGIQVTIVTDMKF